MESEALPKSLCKPLIAQAVKALLMLSQTDIERECYEARLKYQGDVSFGIEPPKSRGRRSASFISAKSCWVALRLRLKS